MAKQADYARYTIRVPDDLYQRLKQAAGEKSVNAEIISRLEASFGRVGDEMLTIHLPKDLLDRIAAAAIESGDESGPANVVLWALLDAFPPPPSPIPTLRDVVDRLKEALRDPPVGLNDADRTAIETYVTGAELAMKADPTLSARAVASGAPLLEPDPK